MADKNKKRPENAPGPYYVDDHCIDCDACLREAPLCFRRHVEKACAYVARQPANDGERKACESALQGCPVEAIGSDGG